MLLFFFQSVSKHSIFSSVFGFKILIIFLIDLKRSDKKMDLSELKESGGVVEELLQVTETTENNEFELDPEKRKEARKMRRIMANRRSAKESRERRKKLLTDLQDSVLTLTSDNTTLTKENLALRREMASVIEQSGGIANLSMIPNIGKLFESAKNFPIISTPYSFGADT